MNAKNMSRGLALVAAILSVFMLLTLTAFAEDTVAATEAATEVVTEATTEVATEADSSATTEADSSATTSATTEAATEATTEAETEAAGLTEEEKTRGIINLIVGGVLLIALVALVVVFRKKIPVWFKALKSECGKIVWCPKDKLKKNTFVVLVTIIVLALAIGILDFAFSRGIMLLRDLFQ